MRSLLKFLLVSLVIVVCVLMVVRYAKQSGAVSSYKNPNEMIKQEVNTVAPGKIAFHSDRGGAKSEIWILENGQLNKVIDDTQVEETIPEGAELLTNMFGRSFQRFREPKWSPDGDLILINTGQSEYSPGILDLNGKIVDYIATNKNVRDMVWAPDGKSIYYTAIDRHADGGGATNIYSKDLISGEEFQITDRAPMPGINRILDIDISHDGSRIVADGNGIEIVNTDGTSMTKILNHASDPKWSPNGEYIVFVTRHDEKGEAFHKMQQICLYEIKTKKITRLTNKWHNRYPEFSPDGNQIVYTSYRHKNPHGGAELFVINIDGTNEIRITPPKRNENYPDDHILGWATDTHPDWTS